MSFTDKVVAVTGGVGGIGQALCRYFGQEGASIAALDKNPEVEAFARTLSAEGIQAIAETLDIADADSVAKAFSSISTKLGGVAILVNNAGFSRHSTFARTDPERWREEIEGNLNGAYHCAYAVLPHMKEKRGGAIVHPYWRRWRVGIGSGELSSRRMLRRRSVFSPRTPPRRSPARLCRSIADSRRAISS
jgi:NAD(P)-dependent dehydrogenase (short-subunit alcohol dehydrogenase family)